MQPNGPVTLGPGGAYAFTVLLEASRLGTDLDGRLYTITVSASNNAGKTGSHAGAVIVPHNQGALIPGVGGAKHRDLISFSHCCKNPRFALTSNFFTEGGVEWVVLRRFLFLCILSVSAVAQLES